MSRSLDSPKGRPGHFSSPAEGYSPLGGGLGISPGGSLGTGNNADLWTPSLEMSVTATPVNPITTYDTTHNIGYNVTVANGKLYAATMESAAENFYLRWDDITAISTVTAVDLGVANKRLSAICYDSVNSCAYIGIFKPSSSSMTIYKVTDLGVVSTLVNGVALGATPSSWQLVPAGSLATDGTSIWATANTVGSAGYIVQFSCVDGTKTNIHQMSATTVLGYEPTALAVYDANNIIAGGSYGWLSKLPKALTSETALVWTDNNGSTLQSVDGLLVIGGNVWAIDYDTTTEIALFKWDGALSGVTRYGTGILTETASGSWKRASFSYDGTNIWVIGALSGTVVKFDPVGGTILATYNDLSGQLAGNDIWVGVYGITGGYVAVSGAGFSGHGKICKATIS